MIPADLQEFWVTAEWLENNDLPDGYEVVEKNYMKLTYRLKKIVPYG